MEAISLCPFYLLRRCAITFASISLHVGLQFYRPGPLERNTGLLPKILSRQSRRRNGKVSGDPQLVKIIFLS
jgi:hypothetical protein